MLSLCQVPVHRLSFLPTTMSKQQNKSDVTIMSAEHQTLSQPVRALNMPKLQPVAPKPQAVHPVNTMKHLARDQPKKILSLTHFQPSYTTDQSAQHKNESICNWINGVNRTTTEQTEAKKHQPIHQPLVEKPKKTDASVIAHAHIVKKPSVPKRSDMLPPPIHRQHDFVKAAKLNLFVTKKPMNAQINSNGFNVNLGTKFVKKSDYGTIPKYLRQRKEELRAEEEQLRLMREKKIRDSFLAEDMKMEILQDLRKKWDELNVNYQKILFKRNQSAKEQRDKLQKALIDLESDISLFEKPKQIHLPSLSKTTHAYQLIKSKMG